MEVRCDKCQARYRVDDARIGPQGLTMRCGKCQNTFKVMKGAPAPSPAAPTAAPNPAIPAAKPAPPQARPAPARPAAPAAAPADEGAGRTMMFQTGNLKAAPAKPKPEPGAGATMVFGQSPVARPGGAPAKPAARSPDPGAGATMVFGQSPAAKAPAPKAAPGPAPRQDGAGSTLMFGQAPAAARAPARTPMPEPEPEPREASPGPAAPPREEPAAPGAGLPPEERAPSGETAPLSGVEAEGAEESVESEPPARQSAFDRAPPKGLLIGVAAGLAALLIAGGTLVAVKKLGRHPPPPAAVETLATAQADADKDTLASIASAEGKAKDALDVAGPRSDFPEGSATLARIEVQWADALNDQANLMAAKGGDDAKINELQTQAKAKLKAAFEVLSPAIKRAPKSPDLQLALADYYRAQRSNTNLGKALKSAQALGVEDARIALVQGMASAQEDDGAEKALPRLKAAAAASPQSARVHFRLALACLAMKDDANASAELKQTLKLSPQHERAKAALEQMAPAAGAK